MLCLPSVGMDLMLLNFEYSLNGGSCTQNNGITCTATFASSSNNCAFVHYSYNLSNLANTGSENENSWEYAQVSYNNGNFGQNVEFFYSNGTVIPSWLESYSSSNAICSF